MYNGSWYNCNQADSSIVALPCKMLIGLTKVY